MRTTNSNPQQTSQHHEFYNASNFTSICIKNLNDRMAIDDLERFMAREFHKFGDFTLKLAQNKKAGGADATERIAFVNFYRHAHARDALRHRHQRFLCGREMFIEPVLKQYSNVHSMAVSSSIYNPPSKSTQSSARNETVHYSARHHNHHHHHPHHPHHPHRQCSSSSRHRSRTVSPPTYSNHHLHHHHHHHQQQQQQHFHKSTQNRARSPVTQRHHHHIHRHRHHQEQEKSPSPYYYRGSSPAVSSSRSKHILINSSRPNRQR